MTLYDDLAAFLAAPALLPGDPVMVSNGPVDANALKVAPGRVVWLTIGGGPGLNTEAMFEGTMVAVRVAGRQMDPGDGEALANAVDLRFLRVDRPRTIGGSRVKSIQRAGGRPIPLLRDSADRYHFTCSYVADAKTGILEGLT